MRKQAKEIGAKLLPEHPQYDLITSAYAAFQRDKPQNTAMCSCCIESEIKTDFFTPDIKDLPLYYVQDWYNGTYDPALSHALWADVAPSTQSSLR